MKLLHSGDHQQEWDGRNDHGQAVATGVYLYRFTAGATTRSGKLIMMK